MADTEWEKIWQERIGAFAQKVGKTPEDIIQALADVIGAPDENSLTLLADEEATPREDIKAALVDLKIPSAKFNKALETLRGPKSGLAPAETSAVAAGPSFETLPSIPDDESFIAKLLIGGQLKMPELDVMSAVKAAIADRVGLYDLPEKLRNRMEQFAEENDEPVNETFYELRNMVVQRNYADVLSAIGIKGHFMNEGRKAKFLNRVDEYLWPALRDFHTALIGWQEAWTKGAANPQMMMLAFAAMGTGGKLPPGIMAPPDTGSVRDTALGVNDRLNKVFAGTGIPVARALAYDAGQIKKVLNDARLPGSIGAANYDQMLKMLGTGVQADYVRMERSIVRYTLAIMELPKVAAGNDELAYLGAMIQLSLTIPWDKLLSGGKKKRTAAEAEEGESQRY
jgi:hypothetical protein